MFVVEHIAIAPYHPRSNGQAERFMNTFKRALKKKKNPTVGPWRQYYKFLQVYWLILNKNMPLAMTLAENVCGK